MTKFLRRLTALIMEAWLPVGLVVLWWFVSLHSTSFYFPSLRTILDTFRQDWLFSLDRQDLLPSMEILALGYSIAIILGVSLGIIIGRSQLIWDVIRPIFELGRATPGIVLIPIVIGAFGIGPWGKVGLSAFACFWPISVNTIDGVRSAEPIWLEMSRSYRLSRKDEFFKVRLRGASPQIMVGIRIGVGVAVGIVVASEIFGATRGVGYFLFSSEENLQVAQTWAATLLLGLIGYGLSVLERRVEHRVLKWNILMKQTQSGNVPG